MKTTPSLSPDNGEIPNYFGTVLLDLPRLSLPPFIMGDEWNNIKLREYKRATELYVPADIANRFIHKALPFVKTLYTFGRTHKKGNKEHHKDMMHVIKEKFLEQLNEHYEITYEFLLALQQDEKFMKLSITDKFFSISTVLLAIAGSLESDTGDTGDAARYFEYLFNSFSKIFLEWIYSIECTRKTNSQEDEKEKCDTSIVSISQNAYEFLALGAIFEKSPNDNQTLREVERLLRKTYTMFHFLFSSYEALASYKSLELGVSPLLNEHDILPALQDYAQTAFSHYRQTKVYQVPINVEFRGRAFKKIGFENFITLVPPEKSQEKEYICKMVFYRTEPLLFGGNSLAQRIQNILTSNGKSKKTKSGTIGNPDIGKKVEILVGRNGELYFTTDEVFNTENGLYSASEKKVYFYLKLVVFEILDKALNFRVVSHGTKFKSGRGGKTYDDGGLLKKISKKPINDAGTPIIKEQEVRKLFDEDTAEEKEETSSALGRFRKVQYTVQILPEGKTPQKEAFEKSQSTPPVPLYVYIVPREYVSDDTFKDEQHLSDSRFIERFQINDMTYTDFKTIFEPMLKKKYPKATYLMRFETRVEFNDKPNEPIGTYMKRVRTQVEETLDKK